MVKSKTGPLSAAERKYILSQAGRTSPEELAKRLNRTVVSVMKAIAEEPPKPAAVAREDSAIDRLRKSSTYAQLRKQFGPDELRLYEERYGELVRQTGEDAPASELMQIHKACVYELLINRNLVQQKEIEDSLRELERVRLRLEGVPEDRRGEADKLRLDVIEGKAAELTRRKKSLSDEHALHDTKQQAVLRDLKMTRDQRLGRIEDRTKTGIVDLVKILMADDKREAEGRRAELMRKAAENWTEELGRPREFADGERDRVLLNADTIGPG